MYLHPYILVRYKVLAHSDVVLGGKAEVLNYSSLVCLTKIKTHNSQLKGQAVRKERVSYLHVALL